MFVPLKNAYSTRVGRFKLKKLGLVHKPWVSCE